MMMMLVLVLVLVSVLVNAKRMVFSAKGGILDWLITKQDEKRCGICY
jgi:hypothetical protein